MRTKDIHQGIYVDIFLLHEAPSAKPAKMRAIISTYYLTLKSLSNRGYDRRKNGTISTEMLMLTWSCPQETPSGSFPKNHLFPAVSMQYDDLEVKAPGEMEKYLEICHRQWDQITNIDKIAWFQHAPNWSVTVDFRKFAPNLNDIRDEDS